MGNTHAERNQHFAERQRFWLKSARWRDARTEGAAQLDDLLARNSEGKLTVEESKQLDSLIEQIDELNLLKARADFTLRHQEDAADS